MQCCLCIFCNSAGHHAWLHGFLFVCLFVILMCMLVVVTSYYMSNDNDFHCPSIHSFILMKIVLKPFTNVITTMAMNVCAPSTVVQRILPHSQHKAFTLQKQLS